MLRWASTEVRVLLRPRATFAELAASPEEGARRLAERIALQLLVLASVVSLTTAGRMVPAHVIGGIVAWSFVPAIQLVAASLGVHLARRGLDLRRVLSIYAAGNGPVLVLLVVAPAVMVLFPSTAMPFWIQGGALPLALGVALLVGVWLTFVFHRVVLEVSPARAAAATAVDLLAKVILSLGWFAGMDNLVPQFLGAAR